MRRAITVLCLFMAMTSAAFGGGMVTPLSINGVTTVSDGNTGHGPSLVLGYSGNSQSGYSNGIFGGGLTGYPNLILDTTSSGHNNLSCILDGYDNIIDSGWPSLVGGAHNRLNTPNVVADGAWDGATLTGTITITNGSTALTGSGTTFLTDLYPGCELRATGNTTAQRVLYVLSDTSAVLTASYSGTTRTGATYRVSVWRYPNESFAASSGTNHNWVIGTYNNIFGTNSVYNFMCGKAGSVGWDGFLNSTIVTGSFDGGYANTEMGNYDLMAGCANLSLFQKAAVMGANNISGGSAQLIAGTNNYGYGTSDVLTGSNNTIGGTAANCWTLTVGNATAGTFEIVYTVAGTAYTSSTLNWNCTAAQVQTAVTGLTAIGAGNAVAAGNPTGIIHIVLINNAGNTNSPWITGGVFSLALHSMVGATPTIALDNAVSDNSFVTGNSNIVTGRMCLVAGRNNMALAEGCTVTGENAYADKNFVWAHAGAKFSTAGDSEEQKVVLGRATTAATAVALGIDNSSTGYTLINNRSYAVHLQSVAIRTSDGASCAWAGDFCIKRVSGSASTALVGTPVWVGGSAGVPYSGDTGPASYTLTVTADSTLGFKILFTPVGESGGTVTHCVATLTITVAG